MDRIYACLEFQEQHDQTSRLMNESLVTVEQNCHSLRDNIDKQRKLIADSIRASVNDDATVTEALQSTLNFYNHTRSELVKLEEVCHEYRMKIQADIAEERDQRLRIPAHSTSAYFEKFEDFSVKKYLDHVKNHQRSSHRECSCNWTNDLSFLLPHTQDINYGPRILMPSEFDATDLKFKQELMILRTKMFSMSQKRSVDVRDKESIADDRRLSIGTATKKEFIEIVKKTDSYIPPLLNDELTKVISLKFVDGEFKTSDVWMRLLDTYGQQLRSKWYLIVCPQMENILRKHRVTLIHLSARKTYDFIMKIPENGRNCALSRKDLIPLVERAEEIHWLENSKVHLRSINGNDVAATLVQSCWRGFWVRKSLFDAKCKYIAASIIWVAWIVVKKKRLMHERYLKNMLVSLDITRQLSLKFSIEYDKTIIDNDHVVIHIPSVGLPLDIRRTFGTNDFSIYQNTMGLKFSFIKNPRSRVIYVLPVKATVDLLAMYNDLIESVLPNENAQERVTFLDLSQSDTFADCSFNVARTLHASEDTLIAIKKIIVDKPAFCLPWIMDECDVRLAGNFGTPLLAPELHLQRHIFEQSRMSIMIEALGLEQPYRVVNIKDYTSLCYELAEQICSNPSICVWLFKLNVGLASRHSGVFLINHMSVPFMPILRKERDIHGDEWNTNANVRANFSRSLRDHLPGIVSTVTRFSECYGTWEDFYSHMTKYGCLLQAVPNHKLSYCITVTLFVPGNGTGETTRWTGTAEKTYIGKESRLSACAFMMPQPFIDNSHFEPVIERLSDALQNAGYFGYLSVDLCCFRRKRDDKIVTLVTELNPFYDHAQHFVDWIKLAINGSYDRTSNTFDADVKLLPDIRMQSSSTIVPYARTTTNWHETTRRFGASIGYLYHSRLPSYSWKELSALSNDCGIQWNSSTKEGCHLILHDGTSKDAAMLIAVTSSMKATLILIKNCLKKLYKALRGETRITINSNLLEAINYIEVSLKKLRNVSVDKCDPLNRVR